MSPSLRLSARLELPLALFDRGLSHAGESDAERDRNDIIRRREFEAAGAGLRYQADRKRAGAVSVAALRRRLNSARHAGHPAQRPSQIWPSQERLSRPVD